MKNDMDDMVANLPVHPPLYKKQLQEITDVFSGADGGVTYVKLRAFLEDMNNRCENGDLDAAKILMMVTRFHSIIQFVKNPPKPNA